MSLENQELYNGDEEEVPWSITVMFLNMREERRWESDPGGG